jgi:hypothetical protein
MNYLQLLEERGWILVPVLTTDQLSSYNSCILKAILEAPEFAKPIALGEKVVLGEVAYSNLNSLWYHPVVRHLMQDCFTSSIQQVFKDMDHSLFISSLVDRLMYRVKGQARSGLSTKKWHQDAAPGGKGNLVTGGWINLNLTEAQVFKCIEGTHKETHPIFQKLVRSATNNEGFAKFSNEDMVFIQKNGGAVEVEIPPGYMLLFNEQMIHTVMPNLDLFRSSTYMLRLHVSFLISQSPRPLMDHTVLMECFRNQQMHPVRSGQDTVTFSTTHVRYHGEKIKELSKLYATHCLDDKGRVRQILPSMEEMMEKTNGAVQMHPSMTAEEMRIFTPRKIGAYLNSPVVEESNVPITGQVHERSSDDDIDGEYRLTKK